MTQVRHMSVIDHAEIRLNACNPCGTSLPMGEHIFQAGQTYGNAAFRLGVSWVNIPEISLPSQGVYYIHTHTGVGVYVIPDAHPARPPPFGQVFSILISNPSSER